jgi:hypothetical protein
MDISGIGIFAAFLAGAISFLSPCVLPLVPGYVSYIAGQPGLRTTHSVGLRARAGALGLSACFVLGFSTVFIALGAGASALGSLLLTWRAELNYLGGGIIILFGLVMLGDLVRRAWRTVSIGRLIHRRHRGTDPWHRQSRALAVQRGGHRDGSDGSDHFDRTVIADGLLDAGHLSIPLDVWVINMTASPPAHNRQNEPVSCGMASNRL